mmetsp:Transcript_56489/g.163820  ORF Transcript_56489/g.163820 Transcript_56489/m.163820 type:complete len:234 (+) Transcript_56489:249-950(+)
MDRQLCCVPVGSRASILGCCRLGDIGLLSCRSPRSAAHSSSSKPTSSFPKTFHRTSPAASFSARRSMRSSSSSAIAKVANGSSCSAADKHRRKSASGNHSPQSLLIPDRKAAPRPHNRCTASSRNCLTSSSASGSPARCTAAYKLRNGTLPSEAPTLPPEMYSTTSFASDAETPSRNWLRSAIRTSRLTAMSSSQVAISNKPNTRSRSNVGPAVDSRLLILASAAVTTRDRGA